MSALFPKKYNSPEELVALLVQRGLAIDDINIASQYIRNIGYYRLSAYLYPLLDMPKEKQQFKSNSHFNKALELYRFDKKLRLFLFNEIEKIEVSFRSNLANMVAEETGNMFWITDSSLFANTSKYNKTLELIDKELKGSKEDFILHFKHKYSNPYPPACGTWGRCQCAENRLLL